MRNILIVTSLLLYFTLILGLCADESTHALYVQHVEQAFKSLFQGNNEDAIESFEAALAIEPDHYEILHYLGMSYTQDKSWNKAVDVYSRALELKSDSIEVLYSLGLVYFNLNQWSDAAVQLKQVIVLSPNHARGHELLGKVYVKLRQYTDAVEILTRTLELKPNSPGNYNELGNAYLKLRSYPEAITNFKNAIKSGPPNFAEPHYGLGTAYVHTGEREKSRSEMLLYQQLQKLNVEYERFTRQTRIEPNNLEGWTGLARILMQQKIYNEAIPVLQKCIALGNSQNASSDTIAGFHHGLSQAFLNLNYPKHALESVGKAILLSPKQSIFYNTLGSTYARLGLIQKAIPSYQQAIMLDGEQPYYHLNISKLYQSVGNRKLAQEHYQAYEFYLSKQKDKEQ